MTDDNEVHVFPMMMAAPTTSLTAMVDEAATFAAECFNATHSLHPMFICDNDAGERTCIAVPMGDHVQRERVAMAMRAMFKEKRVIRYVFLCEAWMLRPGVLKHPSELKGWISDRPDRVEGLAITGEDDEGNTVMVLFDIKRDKAHPYLENKQVIAGNNDTSGGRFGALLERKKKPTLQ